MHESALHHVLAPHGGYRRLFSYGYARILGRATAVFCARAWTYQNEPSARRAGS